MVFILMLASLVGGFTTIVALWSEGWLVAVLCAPLGGSASTLLAATLVSYFRMDEAEAPLHAPDAPMKTVA